MLTEKQQQQREKFIAGLRELADWYEAHPNLLAPRFPQISLFADTKEEFADMRRAMGVSEKESLGDWLRFTKDFSGEWSVTANIEKEKTCRRVQTGEKVVPAQPAQPERVEPVYTWVCDEPLLATEPERAEVAPC